MKALKKGCRRFVLVRNIPKSEHESTKCSLLVYQKGVTK